jgi:peptidoglycan/LPS O-acetylase OafA/YrhL
MPLAHRSSWLDALKGWAVLGVVATHAQFTVAPEPGVLQGLCKSGEYGVQLFFVISAMTLAESWERRNDGIAPFYVRRLLRIVPLFWIAILVYGFALRDMCGLAPFDTVDLVITASFLNALSPDALNLIVPGGWSITAEMTFYAAFPLIVARTQTVRSAIAVLALATMSTIILVPLSYQIVQIFKTSDAAKSFQFFWIGNQIQVFVIGLVAWRMRATVKLTPVQWNLVAAGAATALLLLSTVTQNLHTIYAVLFAVMATAAANGGARWLENPLVTALGKRSYSAYIWHCIAMTMLWSPKCWTSEWLELAAFQGADHAVVRMVALAVATTAATLVLSIVSYRLVERPSIRVGELAGRFGKLQAKSLMSRLVERWKFSMDRVGDVSRRLVLPVGISVFAEKNVLVAAHYFHLPMAAVVAQQFPGRRLFRRQAGDQAGDSDRRLVLDLAADALAAEGDAAEGEAAEGDAADLASFGQSMATGPTASAGRTSIVRRSMRPWPFS